MYEYLFYKTKGINYMKRQRKLLKLNIATEKQTISMSKNRKLANLKHQVLEYFFFLF